MFASFKLEEECGNEGHPLFEISKWKASTNKIFNDGLLTSCSLCWSNFLSGKSCDWYKNNFNFRDEIRS